MTERPITCWVIGGGCYGSGYVRQFRKARARGKMPLSRWVVLDRDPDCRAAGERRPEDSLEIRAGEWRLLLAEIVRGELQPGDLVIPSPFQGMLFADWLADEAAAAGHRVEPEPIGPVESGLRFEQAGDGAHVRYVSFAGWTCPVHCIEPARCPATRGPKDWDLRETMAAWSGAHDYKLLSFTCLHWLYGVGAIPATELLAAREHVRSGKPGRYLVASTSTCHGALSTWRLTPGDEISSILYP